MEVLQKSQKFRALWNGGTEPTKVPGGYKTCCTRTLDIVMGRTKLTEILGAGMKALTEFQKFRVLWHGRTELTEVLVRYKNAVPVPRVFLAPAHRTYRSSGYR